MEIERTSFWFMVPAARPTQVRAALNHNKNFQSGCFSQSQSQAVAAGSKKRIGLNINGLNLPRKWSDRRYMSTYTEESIAITQRQIMRSRTCVQQFAIYARRAR
jgi:hypothetical protein